MTSTPDVAVIAGSLSDAPVYEKVLEVLKQEGVPHEFKVLSAHRDPDALQSYVRASPAKVFVAVAGLSAALPGAIASLTDKPVIGVPVSAKLGGLDALLSMVQMPPGVPVACVGIDNGRNAAHLAVRILKLAK
ncbi:MAG: AIR carboxylase family protein [Promethearchaeota archaeon]